MYYNDPTTKPLAGFISDRLSYTKQHGTENELRILEQLADLIGDLMDNPVDRQDWYSLCNMIAPENVDHNAIS